MQRPRARRSVRANPLRLAAAVEAGTPDVCATARPGDAPPRKRQWTDPLHPPQQADFGTLVAEPVQWTGQRRDVRSHSRLRPSTHLAFFPATHRRGHASDAHRPSHKRKEEKTDDIELQAHAPRSTASPVVARLAFECALREWSLAENCDRMRPRPRLAGIAAATLRRSSAGAHAHQGALAQEAHHPRMTGTARVRLRSVSSRTGKAGPDPAGRRRARRAIVRCVPARRPVPWPAPRRQSPRARARSRAS